MYDWMPAVELTASRHSLAMFFTDWTSFHLTEGGAEAFSYVEHGVRDRILNPWAFVSDPLTGEPLLESTQDELFAAFTYTEQSAGSFAFALDGMFPFELNFAGTGTPGRMSYSEGGSSTFTYEQEGFHFADGSGTSLVTALLSADPLQTGTAWQSHGYSGLGTTSLSVGGTGGYSLGEEGVACPSGVQVTFTLDHGLQGSFAYHEDGSGLRREESHASRSRVARDMLNLAQLGDPTYRGVETATNADDTAFDGTFAFSLGQEGDLDYSLHQEGTAYLGLGEGCWAIDSAQAGLDFSSSFALDDRQGGTYTRYSSTAVSGSATGLLGGGGPTDAGNGNGGEAGWAQAGGGSHSLYDGWHDEGTAAQTLHQEGSLGGQVSADVEGYYWPTWVTGGFTLDRSGDSSYRIDRTVEGSRDGTTTRSSSGTGTSSGFSSSGGPLAYGYGGAAGYHSAGCVSLLGEAGSAGTTSEDLSAPFTGTFWGVESLSGGGGFAVHQEGPYTSFTLSHQGGALATAHDEGHRHVAEGTATGQATGAGSLTWDGSQGEDEGFDDGDDDSWDDEGEATAHDALAASSASGYTETFTATSTTVLDREATTSFTASAEGPRAYSVLSLGWGHGGVTSFTRTEESVRDFAGSAWSSSTQSLDATGHAEGEDASSEEDEIGDDGEQADDSDGDAFTEDDTAAAGGGAGASLSYQGHEETSQRQGGSRWDWAEQRRYYDLDTGLGTSTGSVQEGGVTTYSLHGQTTRWGSGSDSDSRHSSGTTHLDGSGTATLDAAGSAPGYGGSEGFSEDDDSTETGAATLTSQGTAGEGDGYTGTWTTTLDRAGGETLQADRAWWWDPVAQRHEGTWSLESWRGATATVHEEGNEPYTDSASASDAFTTAGSA